MSLTTHVRAEREQTNVAPPAGRAERIARRRRRERVLTGVRLAGAIVMCLVLLLPLYWMVVVAFTSRATLLSGDLDEL